MKTLIAFCIAAVIILGCDDNDKTEVTLMVKENKASCSNGVFETECYLVQQGDKIGSNNWELFYEEIQGFSYEPGFTYKLVVAKETIDNPPMDASSIKYTLVKQLSKEPR